MLNIFTFITFISLATWLRYHFLDKVDSVIFLSPFFGTYNKKSEILTKPIIGPIFQAIFLGKYREWTPANEQQAKHWKYRYRSRAVTELVRLVQKVRKLPLEKIRTPSCWFYTKHDTVISMEELQKAHERFLGGGSLLNFHKPIVMCLRGML